MRVFHKWGTPKWMVYSGKFHEKRWFAFHFRKPPYRCCIIFWLWTAIDCPWKSMNISQSQTSQAMQQWGFGGFGWLKQPGPQKMCKNGHQFLMEMCSDIFFDRWMMDEIDEDSAINWAAPKTSMYWFYTKRKLAYFRESKNLTRESCAKALAKEGLKVLSAKAPRKLEMIVLC